MGAAGNSGVSLKLLKLLKVKNPIKKFQNVLHHFSLLFLFCFLFSSHFSFHLVLLISQNLTRNFDAAHA